jgi:type I restriction enzyme, R subunit
MSKLLDALIEQRRRGVMTYTEYLQKIANLARASQTPGGPESYPASIQSAAQRALFNNLGKKEALALAVNAAILSSLQDDWRNNTGKTKRVRNAIRFVLSTDIPADQGAKVQQGDGDSAPRIDLDTETDRILELAKHQGGY